MHSDDETFVEELDIGDKAYLCLERIMQSSGKYLYYYDLYIAYRNLYMGVTGAGVEDEFDLERVLEIANKQMEKIYSQPLVDEVTFSP